MNFSIEVADLENPIQGKALVEILDSYARGPAGQNEPLSARARSTLVKGLYRSAGFGPWDSPTLFVTKRL